MEKKYEELMQDIYLLQCENQDLVNDLNRMEERQKAYDHNDQIIEDLQSEILRLGQKLDETKTHTEQNENNNDNTQGQNLVLEKEIIRLENDNKVIKNRLNSLQKTHEKTIDSLRQEKQKNSQLLKNHNKLTQSHKKLSGTHEKLASNHQELSSSQSVLLERINNEQTQNKKLRDALDMYESSLTLRQKLLIQKRHKAKNSVSKN